MSVLTNSFWNGRRVFVTGHTGFKGTWLCLWLHSLGARITGFSDLVPTSPSHFDLAKVSELLVHDLRGDVRSAPRIQQAIPMSFSIWQPSPLYRLAILTPWGHLKPT